MGAIVYFFAGKQSNSVVYSIKIWLTSVFTAPVIFISISALQSQNHYDNPITRQLYLYGVCILMGALLSFITWMLFLLIIKVFIIYFYNIKAIKIITGVLGMLLTFGTFFVFLGLELFSDNGLLFLVMTYIICIGSSSLCYNLRIHA
jgi:hypothetical protein